VLASDRSLLYAGLGRGGQAGLELVKWTANGRSQWIDAANAAGPPPTETSGFIMPAQGPVTSYFGYRYHPILHFTRFHAGIDIGAGWGSPIVAAADGQVAAAGWAGGYGREVQISHGGGITSLYGHMSEIVTSPGSFVRAGQVIGYVGSSGLSTGPHVHFEVRVNGQPMNPLEVRLQSRSVISGPDRVALNARFKALMAIGAKG
jgi:murein DD-endopeptidase MepM/ murein hydrolase activator NlpD